MTVLEILTNLGRIAYIYELWKNRINTLNLGRLNSRQIINRTLRLLEYAATDPNLDKIINEKFQPGIPDWREPSAKTA
jgi:hypothetical protein